MGAGKTTLAEALARRWVRPLRDSDADLLCEHGRSAAQLAAELGADSLHGLEATHLLRALADRPAPVIAAAASVVDRAECRRAV
jgi:shikimate kinase